MSNFIRSLFVFVLLLVGSSSQAFAKPSKASLEEAKALYIEGSELVEDEQYEQAIAVFKESYRLSKNPLLLYNIAAAYDQWGKNKKSILFYTQFLKKVPKKNQHRSQVKRRIRELRQGKSRLRFSPTVVKRFTHTPIEEAQREASLDITVQIPTKDQSDVTLYYRLPDRIAFTSLEMKEIKYHGVFVAEIPERALTQGTIQYYIITKTDQGEITGRSGRRSSPHIISLYGDTFEDNDAQDFDLFSPEIEPYVRIGATAVSGIMFATSLLAYFKASDISNVLELASTNQCTSIAVRPCYRWNPIFDGPVQDSGQNWSTASTFTFVLGLASGGLAGYSWWRYLSQSTSNNNTDSEDQWVIGPMINHEGLVGTWVSFDF